MLHLLLIEFLDELIYGLREAAWPQIRTDLQLTYAEIGILLGLPGIASSLVEPFLGIFSDRGKRQILIIGGGILYALSLVITGISHTFLLLLLSFFLFYPSCGAIVSLSQTEMMDKQPNFRVKNMAKWSLAGSVGVVLGPLLFSGILLVGGNWRTPFFIFSGLTLVLTVIKWRKPVYQINPEKTIPFSDSIRRVFHALLDLKVLRWLILLTFSNLMLDVFLGFLTLYFVDVVFVSQHQASIAVGVWAVVGLVGDLLLIPLLDKVPGLIYLKRSTFLELILFPIFLIIPGYGFKLIFLAGMGLFNAGWYSILKAQLYNSLPNNSGIVLAISNIFGILGVFVPWCIGLIADRYGLPTAIWFLFLGPVGLLFGLPRQQKS